MKEENFIGYAKEATDFLGNTYQFDCMGCSITKGDMIPPGGFVYENENFLISQDMEIPINGFLVINIKRHANSLMDLNEEERHQLIDLMSLGIKAIKNLEISKEVTIVQEERSKHFHVWLFPNQPWMIDKFGNGVSFLRDISSYAQEHITQDTIKEILSSIDQIRKYFRENID